MNAFVSQKEKKRTILDKTHLKIIRVNGSIMNGFQEPVLRSISLFRPA